MSDNVKLIGFFLAIGLATWFNASEPTTENDPVEIVEPQLPAEQESIDVPDGGSDLVEEIESIEDSPVYYSPSQIEAPRRRRRILWWRR